MTKPTTQVLEACARLQASEPRFMEYLETRLQDYHSDMVKQQDEVLMRWAQGRAQELEDLIKLLKQSPEYLRKAGR